jgi:REP element-mobilizing transposase RayT
VTNTAILISLPPPNQSKLSIHKINKQTVMEVNKKPPNEFETGVSDVLQFLKTNIKENITEKDLVSMFGRITLKNMEEDIKWWHTWKHE